MKFLTSFTFLKETVMLMEKNGISTWINQPAQQKTLPGSVPKETICSVD